jgi:hypothetical protein
MLRERSNRIRATSALLLRSGFEGRDLKKLINGLFIYDIQ